MMKHDDLIYVAGHAGMVGSALLRELAQQGYHNLLTRDSTQLDLRDRPSTNDFFAQYQPAYVFLAAARVGGIAANRAQPVEFLADNLAIASNVIQAAYAQGSKRLVNFGSSCIYPRLAPQPIEESALLTGPLEPTNEAYALAKIAALKLCVYYRQQYGADFYSLMPTNLYGLGDNYDPETSHVLPALLRHFHQAKITGAATVTLWGDGSPLRELLFADDLAAAAIMCAQNYSASDVGDWINIGSGQEVSIAQLADIVSSVVYANKEEDVHKPEIIWDCTMPSGTPRKLLDSSKIAALGWTAGTSLREGIELAYRDYLNTL
ncbi:MAG: GDP-L-fucose synthase [Coriobacteriia bacterium]|nr:GDP-L-fucose synthase [Coriobacteriia bacterium]